MELDDDDDNDGTVDAEDAFPIEPSETSDSDADGIGDNGDAFPQDASKQYLSINEALAGIGDPGFLACVGGNERTPEHQPSPKHRCNNDFQVGSVQGVQAFANRLFRYHDTSVSDLAPLTYLTNLKILQSVRVEQEPRLLPMNLFVIYLIEELWISGGEHGLEYPKKFSNSFI